LLTDRSFALLSSYFFTASSDTIAKGEGYISI
jgi:hypothetical protein